MFYQQAFNALWLVWAIYWCAAAIGAKRTRYRERVASGLVHLVPMFLGIALLVFPRIGFGWLRLRYLPRTPVWFFVASVSRSSALAFPCTHASGLGATGAAR
jgi:hypothetical protein